jgi:hypothetical protein
LYWENITTFAFSDATWFGNAQFSLVFWMIVGAEKLIGVKAQASDDAAATAGTEKRCCLSASTY